MIKTIKKVKYFLEGKYISVHINKIPKQWFGNNYGGFYLAQQSIEKSSIVYSIGIGEDISFDIELMATYGCNVFAFDPTPKSVLWVKENVTTPNFVFSPIGVAKEKGVQKLYLPINDNHVSGSIHDIKTINTSNTIDLKFDTLMNIMEANNHSKIDVLKMDIEGAEYEVIDNIHNHNIDIKQILVEFHPHLLKNGKMKTKIAIEKLQKMGYNCFGVSDSLLEYSFIK